MDTTQPYYSKQRNNNGPFSRFEYAIKSEETRRKYVRRLEIFFDFYHTRGSTIEQKAENFVKITKGKKGMEKTTDLILNYMSFQIERASQKMSLHLNSILTSVISVTIIMLPTTLNSEANAVLVNKSFFSVNVSDNWVYFNFESAVGVNITLVYY
jgi:hypothetical protein